MKFKIAGGKGSVIPNGVIEDLLINIRDGVATYHFKDSKTTRAFTLRQNKDGVKSQYIERIQTCICFYPEMNQEALVNHISKRIKSLELKNET